MQTFVRIQQEDFSQQDHYSTLATGNAAGAVVTFVGRVRDFGSDLTATEKPGLWLEYYPGMTEKVLQQLLERAGQRWPILAARIVHRVGSLSIGDQIVFVGVSAAHRHDAFAASEFLMDYLKTEAPFWKREGDKWVTAKTSDAQATERWNAYD
jgi:molybdopterin synthase catalytic subunit